MSQSNNKGKARLGMVIVKLLLVSSPVLFILGIYVYNDPFKVLYHYNSYFPENGTQYVHLNKDYVSTETFVNNYDKYLYDSYIFGNSRSMRYHIADWRKHLNSTKCFHFDANGETLLGIEKKLEFLHNKGIPVKNALFIIDHEVLKYVKNSDGHIFIIDPKLSGESSIVFQFKFLETFFYPEFLEAYLHFMWTKKLDLKANHGWEFFDNTPEEYDPIINEQRDMGQDAAITSNRDSFYTARKDLFYTRDSVQRYYPATIGTAQKELIAKIKGYLDENHTAYKIVINPLYNQKKIDTTDLQYLKATFGANRVFDFSGINEITQDKYNYYENSHYRPFIANRIMDSIYATN